MIGVPAPSERLIATSCAHCGGPVTYPGRGKHPRYCGRSCRQRAYELRRAGRAPAAAGPPVRQVVERVVERPHPRTVPGWIAALDELAAQLRGGALTAHPHRRDELQRALAGAAQALAGPAGTAPPAPSTRTSAGFPPPAPGVSTAAAVMPAASAVHAHLTAAGAEALTSIGRLAAALAVDESTVRGALAVLVASGEVVLVRAVGGGRGERVDVGQVAAHAGFQARVAGR